MSHLLSDSLSSEICSKIVHKLSKHFLLNYEWYEVENLTKMFVIFAESTLISGDRLFQYSSDNKSFLENSFKIMFDESTNAANFAIIINNILNSKNAIKNGIILDNILGYIKKYTNNKINIDSFSFQMSNINLNKTKMYVIVERIFSLPFSNINNAIEIITKNIGFEVLGYVFCESYNSIYFGKCSIISDVICHEIRNFSKCISDFFMPSILISLNSKTGKALYKECVKNEQFCESINLFFKHYLRKFEKNSNARCKKRYIIDFLMCHIMYMKCNKINNIDLAIFKECTVNSYQFVSEYFTYINIIST